MPLLPGAEPFHHDGGDVGALVLHGFTGSPRGVRPWAEHLAEAGFTVTAPRLPGHGTTWQDLGATRWPDWYAEVERSFLELRATTRTVVVMGLSMGGTLALRLAARHGDEVAGLVLVNPSVHGKRHESALLPVVSRVLPSVPGLGNDIARDGVDEGAYDRTPLRAATSLIGLWSATRADITRVVQPLLLLHSRTDHVVAPSNSAWVLAHVGSADVTEVVLERSYHVATLDHDAPLLFEASTDFALRVSARVGLP